MRTAEVYVMLGSDGHVKVGHSRRPEARSRQLGLTPEAIKHRAIVAHAEAIEKQAHRLLKAAGKHVRNEWFSASVEEAIAALDRAKSLIAIGGVPARSGNAIADAPVCSLRMPRALRERLDTFIARARPGVTRSDVLLEMIEAGLATSGVALGGGAATGVGRE